MVHGGRQGGWWLGAVVCQAEVTFLVIIYIKTASAREGVFASCVMNIGFPFPKVHKLSRDSLLTC